MKSENIYYLCDMSEILTKMIYLSFILDDEVFVKSDAQEAVHELIDLVYSKVRSVPA